MGYFQTPWHIVLLLLIALLLFGGKRLPEIGKRARLRDARVQGRGHRQLTRHAVDDVQPELPPAQATPVEPPTVTPTTATPPSARPSSAGHDEASRAASATPRRRPLDEHLEELRDGSFAMLGALAVGTVVAYVFHGHVLDWLNRPLPAPSPPAARDSASPSRSPSRSRSALYAGFVLALPVILWQLWLFFAPAFDPSSERKVLGLALFAVVLAAAGVAFGYWVLLPARGALPHPLRPPALPRPTPGVVVLQLRGHGARRDRGHLPDAARDSRARLASAS